MSKFNVGNKVRYIGTEHDINSQWYPSIGTIGTVVENVDEINCYIQWTKGSTSKEDRWYCNKNDIELVEDTDMTNEEIWKMLESKMHKNGLKPCGSHLLFTGNISNVYALEDVHNAIALAYKVGYLRSQKGRPFKIGEKKKKGGHWVPVDPNNLPKEGTKVRYSREIDKDNDIPFNKWSGMKIGDETVVMYAGPLFGVKDIYDKYPYSKYMCCNDYPNRFDMWVEDDE